MSVSSNSVSTTRRRRSQTLKRRLTRLIADVDELCARKNGDQLVSSILRKIDGVTRLSAWSDPKKHH